MKTRTLNWTRGIGYNLILAEIRNGYLFGGPEVCLEWLMGLAQVSFVEFGELFPHYEPHPELRMLDRTTAPGPAQAILFEMIDKQGITAMDLIEAGYVMVRYLSMHASADQ